MISGKYELSVFVNDAKVREYYHNFDTFIEGREKSPFRIVATNNSNQNSKVVISVDGLSIIDGKPASENSQGYVIQSYQAINIDGWRTSNDTVNQFVFQSKRKSYSSEMNMGTQNVGVIGAMFFEEQRPLQYRSYYPIKGSASDTSAIGIYDSSWTVASAAVSNNLGTGFGDSIHSSSYESHEIFNTTPKEILIMYYDDRKGLEKRGIVFDYTRITPNPFPNSKFAKFPHR